MGNYTEFRINGKEVYSTKWGYHSALLLVFTPADKHTVDPVEDEDPRLFYRTTAGIARERLDVLGYTLPAARAAFARNLGRLAEEIAGLDVISDDPASQIGAEVDEDWARTQTFEKWCAEIRHYLHPAEEQESTIPIGPLSFDDFEDGVRRDIAGFPGDDVLAFLRGALHACDYDATVEYDLGTLVDHGYVDAEDEPVTEARFAVGADLLPGQKIIVLTEGSTDSRILKASVELLSPHIAEYYSFIDYDEMKAPGGAGNALAFLKAFLAAGITNRIVVILDNDTAARSALRSIVAVRLPKHACVMHYPPIPLATSYPTMGPSGPVMMDVNGSAGSIELYLGADVLTKEDGMLVPIQWSTFEPKLQAYQGEVQDKREIQARFWRKLHTCRRNPSQVNAYDWSGIRAIIDALRSAFQATTELS